MRAAPAAPATTPTTATATPTLDLLNGSVVETLRVHPAEVIDIGVGCHVVDSGQPQLQEEFLAPLGPPCPSGCPTGSGSVGDWIGTVGPAVDSGTYSVSVTWHGQTYSGNVQLMGGNRRSPRRRSRVSGSAEKVADRSLFVIGGGRKTC